MLEKRRTLLLACLAGAAWPATWLAASEKPAELRRWGSGQFRRFGFLVYEATLWAGDEGLEVRLGQGELADKLDRLERVLAAVAADGQRAEVLHLDNRRRPDWVAVRLAGRRGESDGRSTVTGRARDPGGLGLSAAPSAKAGGGPGSSPPR